MISHLALMIHKSKFAIFLYLQTHWLSIKEHHVLFHSLKPLSFFFLVSILEIMKSLFQKIFFTFASNLQLTENFKIALCRILRIRQCLGKEWRFHKVSKRTIGWHLQTMSLDFAQTAQICQLLPVAIAHKTNKTSPLHGQDWRCPLCIFESL